MNTNISSRALDAKARIAALKTGQVINTSTKTGGNRVNTNPNSARSPTSSSSSPALSVSSPAVSSSLFLSTRTDDPLLQAALATNQLTEAKSYVQNLDNEYNQLQRLLQDRYTVYHSLWSIYIHLYRLRCLFFTDQEDIRDISPNDTDKYWSLLQECWASFPLIQSILDGYTAVLHHPSPEVSLDNEKMVKTAAFSSHPTSSSSSSFSPTSSHHHHYHKHHHDQSSSSNGSCCHSPTDHPTTSTTTAVCCTSSSSSSSCSPTEGTSSASSSIRSWQQDTTVILLHSRLHVTVFTILYYVLIRNRPVIAMELCRYYIVQYPYYLPFWFLRGYLVQFLLLPLTTTDSSSLSNTPNKDTRITNTVSSSSFSILTLRSTLLLYQFHLDKCIRLCSQQPDYIVDNYLHHQLNNTKYQPLPPNKKNSSNTSDSTDDSKTPTNSNPTAVSSPSITAAALSSEPLFSSHLSLPVITPSATTHSSASSSSSSSSSFSILRTTLSQALQIWYPMYFSSFSISSSSSFSPAEQFSRLQECYRMYLTGSSLSGNVRLPVSLNDTLVQYFTPLKYHLIQRIQTICSQSSYYHEDSLWLTYVEQKNTYLPSVLPSVSLIDNKDIILSSLLTIHHRLSHATLLFSEGFYSSSRLYYTSLLYTLSRLWFREILPIDILINTKLSGTIVSTTTDSTASSETISPLPFHHQLFNLVFYLHRVFVPTTTETRLLSNVYPSSLVNPHTFSSSTETSSLSSNTQLFTYSLFYHICYGLVKSIYSLEYISFSNEGQEQNKHYLQITEMNSKSVEDSSSSSSSSSSTQILSSYDYSLQLLCEILFALSRKLTRLDTSSSSSVSTVYSSSFSSSSSISPGLSSSSDARLLPYYRYHPQYYIHYIYASCTASLGLFDTAFQSLSSILPLLSTSVSSSTNKDTVGSLKNILDGSNDNDKDRIQQPYKLFPWKTILGGTFLDLDQIQRDFATSFLGTNDVSTAHSAWFGYKDTCMLIRNNLWSNYRRIEKLFSTSSSFFPTVASSATTTTVTGGGSVTVAKDKDTDIYSIEKYTPAVLPLTELTSTVTTGEWILNPLDLQRAMKRIRYLKKLRGTP